MTISDPIDMREFMKAVYDWYTSSTGLFTIWTGQSKTRPSYPYGTLTLVSGPIPIANQPELRYDDNPTQPAPSGAELELVHSIPCTITVSCQARVSQDNANSPDTFAKNYTNRALLGLSQLTQRALWREANIGIIEARVLSLPPDRLGEAFISRDGLEIVFTVVLSSTEFETYIEKMDIESPDLGIPTTTLPE